MSKAFDRDSGRVQWRDETIRDQEVVLGATKDCDQVYQVVFDNCTLELIYATRARFFKTVFRNCTIRPRKRVRATWSDCIWENCIFHGSYISTHFGSLDYWRDSCPHGNIAVRSCDFSKAKLHFCFFDRTELASMTFPKWPCFTLLNPQRNYPSWRAKLSSIKPNLLYELLFESRDRSDAFVLHWPTLAKDLRIATNAEEAKEILQSLDEVLL